MKLVSKQDILHFSCSMDSVEYLIMTIQLPHELRLNIE